MEEGAGRQRETFVVRILYQQNNTWQGEVLWAEQNQKQYFRSALELLSLMDSAVKVAVTNNSTAPLYNAYITDTMDPGLTMNEGVDSEGDNSGAEGTKCVYAGYNGTTVRKGLECKVYKWNLTGTFEVGDSVTLYYTAVAGEVSGDAPDLLNVAYARGYKNESAGQRARGKTAALSDDLDYVEGSSDNQGNNGYVDDSSSGVIITVKTYPVTYKWNLPDAASEKLPTEPSHKKGGEVTVDAEYAKGKESPTEPTDPVAPEDSGSGGSNSSNGPGVNQETAEIEDARAAVWGGARGGEELISAGVCPKAFAAKGYGAALLSSLH